MLRVPLFLTYLVRFSSELNTEADSHYSFPLRLPQFIRVWNRGNLRVMGSSRCQVLEDIARAGGLCE